MSTHIQLDYEVAIEEEDLAEIARTVLGANAEPSMIETNLGSVTVYATFEWEYSDREIVDMVMEELGLYDEPEDYQVTQW